MPRLTNLDDVLFPVAEHPVFASVKTSTDEKRLSVPDKKAIVNTKSGRVLGVVSRGYRLVSNREALDMAAQCCRHVFPDTKDSEWEVKATDAPATGGHCFIDLVHNSTALDFNFVPAKERPDVFGPFIRVTNSYNGLRALAFDIGFHRKVCKNGLILPDSIIRFKFTHLRREIGESVRFEISHEKLGKMKSSFEGFLGVLKECPVDREQFAPLMHAVLHVRKPKNAVPESKQAEAWEALEGHIAAMCDRYVRELGENAYAVLNAVTEFASHPPDNRCVYRERHSFQRRAGAWLTGFSRECKQSDFDLQTHIDTLRKNGSRSDTDTATLYGRQA